jgi:hypothetical protein
MGGEDSTQKYGYPASDGTYPTAIIDFERGFFLWGGQRRQLSDLTVAAAGGYWLSGDLGLTGGEATVLLEWSPNTSDGQFTGTLFSWTSGYPSGSRTEWYSSDNPTYGDAVNVYVKELSPSAAFVDGSAFSKLGETGSRRLLDARYRQAWTFKNGETVKSAFTNAQVYEQTGKTITTIAAPIRFGFGNRVWATGTPVVPDAALSGATLHRVIIYNKQFSSPVLDNLAATGRSRPVHLLGDSFLNIYEVTARLERLLKPGALVSVTQDGVGGTSATQQATRFQTGPTKWRSSTLVWCEMGLDGVWADWETAANTVKGLLSNHERYLIMEPAPQESDGTAERITWDAFVANMQAWAGSKWIPTLDAAMALSTGSAQDVAKVASRRWPTSITVSDVDFHPNSIGQQLMADLIYQKLTQFGWVT